MQQIDITNVLGFTRGEARFSRIANNARTGVQAWRRSYTFAPWLDRVEFIIPEDGKYYPGEAKRHIKADDPKLWEKISFYLEKGISGFFPGDEVKSIYDD